ncbi:MAG: hypothetical protein WC335_07890 [Candidatus Omnitrophota bacterium]|jgi:hypothetical protein
MRKSVEIILLDSETDYRKEYEEVFVKNSYFLRGVPIDFNIKSFDHIFFEPTSEENKKGKFSHRRAKKMLFIRAVLNETVLIEITFEEENGTIALFCTDLDCVVYLRNRVGTGKLQIGTFIDFGKDHTKMYEKQRRKCVPVSIEELRKLVK